MQRSPSSSHNSNPRNPGLGAALLRAFQRADGPAACIPMVAHVIHRLDFGGLENGLVNLINRMPADRYRHAVICMTDYTDFRARIARPDVHCYALHKRAGKDPGAYLRLYRLLRRLRPDIVHTRNLAALEGLLPAALAGGFKRVHGEHGWDVGDLNGRNARHRLLRRCYRPLVHRYIPLSRHLQAYLQHQVGVATASLTQIYNGVDTERFRPAEGGRGKLPLPGFAPPGSFVIGTVGRMAEVKDPLNLVRGFLHLLGCVPDGRERLRLVMIGDGPLRARAQAMLAEAGAAELAWLPGARDDVPALLRAMDVFVLPSLAEGICNTVLEAMASGLPVVATRVGGNPELVVDGTTGLLVPAADRVAIAYGLRHYLQDPASRMEHGGAARERAVRHFALERMVQQYLEVYDAVLGR
jgi:sugar transferase (PEP-CTERM/EpsH1 system associated)